MPLFEQQVLRIIAFRSVLVRNLTIAVFKTAGYFVLHFFFFSKKGTNKHKSCIDQCTIEAVAAPKTRLLVIYHRIHGLLPAYIISNMVSAGWL